MGADILGKRAWGSLFKSRPFKVVTGLAVSPGKINPTGSQMLKPWEPRKRMPPGVGRTGGGGWAAGAGIT